jgi:hypothetical protein
MQSQDLPLSELRLDGGTQMRGGIEDAVLQEYVEAYRRDDCLPPLEVFNSGTEYWLADGFQRHKAALQCGREALPCNVRQGSRRDAILYACGANATHGLRRTNADKRRAIETLLKDTEWCEFSDRQIADLCNVSHTLVSTVRSELVVDNKIVEVSTGNSASSIEERGRLGRDGKRRPANQPSGRVRSEPYDAPTSSPDAALDQDEVAIIDRCQALGGPFDVERESSVDTATIDPQKADVQSSGRASVSRTERKRALAAFGVVVRFIDKLYGHEKCRAELELIDSIIRGSHSESS